MTPRVIVSTAVSAVIGVWAWLTVGLWPGIVWVPLMVAGIVLIVNETLDWAERHEHNGWTEHDDHWER